MPRLLIEQFKAIEGQVLEPVAEEKRGDYTYWRAAHLGNIALNFIEDRQYLNAWGADYAHFTDRYDTAKNIAADLSQPNSQRQSQFGDIHKKLFHKLTGIPQDFAYPAIIYALDKRLEGSIHLENRAGYDPFGDDFFNIDEFFKPMSFGGGHVVYGQLTLDMIDEYSRRAIKDLFES